MGSQANSVLIIHGTSAKPLTEPPWVVRPRVVVIFNGHSAEPLY